MAAAAVRAAVDVALTPAGGVVPTPKLCGAASAGPQRQSLHCTGRAKHVAVIITVVSVARGGGGAPAAGGSQVVSPLTSLHRHRSMCFINTVIEGRPCLWLHASPSLCVHEPSAWCSQRLPQGASKQPDTKSQVTIQDRPEAHILPTSRPKIGAPAAARHEHRSKASPDCFASTFANPSLHTLGRFRLCRDQASPTWMPQRHLQPAHLCPHVGASQCRLHRSAHLGRRRRPCALGATLPLMQRSVATRAARGA